MALVAVCLPCQDWLTDSSYQLRWLHILPSSKKYGVNAEANGNRVSAPQCHDQNREAQGGAAHWTQSVDFFARTGVPAANVRFCLTREEKAPICEELALTHFIDDRVHIMQILRGTVANLYLFGDEPDARTCPPWATFVSTWAHLNPNTSETASRTSAKR